MSKELSIGMKVKFIDKSLYPFWNVTRPIGHIIKITKYGPLEAMVTVQFGSVRIHTSDISLCPV